MVKGASGLAVLAGLLLNVPVAAAQPADRRFLAIDIAAGVFPKYQETESGEERESFVVITVPGCWITVADKSPKVFCAALDCMQQRSGRRIAAPSRNLK